MRHWMKAALTLVLVASVVFLGVPVYAAGGPPAPHPGGPVINTGGTGYGGSACQSQWMSQGQSTTNTNKVNNGGGGAGFFGFVVSLVGDITDEAKVAIKPVAWGVNTALLPFTWAARVLNPDFNKAEQRNEENSQLKKAKSEADVVLTLAQAEFLRAQAESLRAPKAQTAPATAPAPTPQPAAPQPAPVPPPAVVPQPVPPAPKPPAPAPKPTTNGQQQSVDLKGVVKKIEAAANKALDIEHKKVVDAKAETEAAKTLIANLQKENADLRAKTTQTTTVLEFEVELSVASSGAPMIVVQLE